MKAPAPVKKPIIQPIFTPSLFNLKAAAQPLPDREEEGIKSLSDLVSNQKKEAQENLRKDEELK